MYSSGRLATRRGFIQSSRGGCSIFDCGVSDSVLSVGMGSAMEGPGLGFRGREASLVQPRVSVDTWQTSEGFSLEGISTTSFG